jgi:DNA-binding HxlR family transcriptional regulator
MRTSSSRSSVSTVCSRFHRAIELIGGRWTGAIVQTLLQGRTRYAAIRGAIPDITDRMLSERLRSLEAEGLVTRVVIPETPVRVEYDLTAKGRELESALRELGKWAERWIPLDTKANAPVTQSHPAKPGHRRRSANAAAK